MNVGDTVLLEGKTQHGKNKVREKGQVKTVLQIGNPICHNGKPAFLVGGNNDLRWILLENDPDFSFTVIKVEPRDSIRKAWRDAGLDPDNPEHVQAFAEEVRRQRES